MPTYAALADITLYGMPIAALGRLTTAQQQAALDAASSEMDTYFSARYGAGMPLLAWDIATTEKCVEIAQWKLLNIRGYNPAAGADVNIRDRWIAALAWCAGVERQRVHPKVTLTAAPYQGADAPLVLSRALQGWYPTDGSSGI